MAQQFGRFWLHKKVGQGGMAEIFRATIGPDAETFNFDFAVKRLPPGADKKMVDMFHAEADIGTVLNHPNLIRVFQAGLVETEPYIAMEYLAGADLARLCAAVTRQRLTFPADLAVYVAEQLLRGLDYIHRARTPKGEPMHMVHRDVTPSNVIITFAGEVKLGDFGIARVSFLEGSEGPIELRGKAAYMPPEVLRGEGDINDPRLDLWCLAATLYEMVTGSKPYGTAPEDDLLFGDVPAVAPANKVAPGVDPKLAQILKRALHPNIRKRPPDAITFYRQLKGYRLAQGIQVDAAALGRFIRQVMGVTEEEAHRLSGPGHEDFERPQYQVPYERTLTQRIQLVKRQRTLRLYIGMLAAALAGVLAALAWRQWVSPKPAAPTLPSPVAPVAAAPPTPTPTPTAPAPTAPVVQSGTALSSFEGHFDFSGLDELETKRAPREKQRGLRDALRRGRQLSERREYREAAEAYHEAMQQNPNHTGAILGLANALFFLEAYNDATKLVDHVLNGDANNPRALLLRADLLRARAKSPAAKQAYQQVTLAAPQSRQGKQAQKILDEW